MIPHSRSTSIAQPDNAFFRTLQSESVACPKSINGEPCAEVNRFWFLRPSGTRAIAYATCECGTRFPNNNEIALPTERVVDLVTSHDGDTDIRSEVDVSLCPDHLVTRWGKIGIVPVGTPVLHRPSQSVRIGDTGAIALGGKLIERMNNAHGVGLAANQVGVPLKVMVHKAKGLDTQVLINPLIVRRSTEIIQIGEGCLSLAIEGTYGVVMRSSRIMVVAGTVDGGFVCIEAGGFLAIVLQHEIDHLDGIEYVQRLTQPERRRVYKLMRQGGIDLAVVPHIGPAK